MKKEVDKLSDSVCVYSDKGSGTVFCFSVPLEEMTSIMEITVADIMNPIIETSRSFVKEYVEPADSFLSGFHIEHVSKLILKKVASFINIKGILKGKFIMSMDENLLKAITEKFILDELTEEEITAYMEDTLAECSNIILGNSIKKFRKIEEFVTLEAPVTMLCDNAIVKYIERDIWTCRMNYKFGSMSISFIADELLS